MKILDISMGIHEQMAVYKGRREKLPQRVIERQTPRDSINESRITMNLHTGTHLDAPLHMVHGGSTIDKMPLERLITKCRLFDLTQVNDCITQEDVEGLGIQAGDFVLLKTQNSFGLANSAEFVYIQRDAAEHLATLGITGIGIDALGVERDQTGHATHLAFMNKDVIILEGLDLKEAQPGSYTLIALPLKILGAEGAPARAILLDNLSILN